MIKYSSLEILRTKYKYYSNYLWALIIVIFGSGICGIGALYNLKKIETALHSYGVSGNENTDIIADIEKRLKYIHRFLSIGKVFFAVRTFFTIIFIWGLILSFNDFMNVAVMHS